MSTIFRTFFMKPLEQNYSDLLKSLRDTNSFSQKELADLLGVTQRTISHWENGRSEPNLSILRKIKEQFDISIDAFLSMSLNSMPKSVTLMSLNSEKVSLNSDKEPFDDFIVVDYYPNVAFSAGGGAFPIDEERLRVPIWRYWANQHNLTADKLKMLDVRGDSMTPTVEDGDSILINISKNDVRRISSSLYAFRLADSLLIKRLMLIDNFKLRVISDNKAYDDYTLDLKNSDTTESFQLLGHVALIFKNL